MGRNRKVLALLCVFIIDILCWYLDKEIFLFPLGIMYITLFEIFLVEYLFLMNAKYLFSQQSWLLVMTVVALLVGIQAYELITLDRSCGGCKAKMWELSYPYLSGISIAIGLLLISHKFNRNKPVVFLLVLLSIFWVISEPFTNYQLSLPVEMRSGVYDFPIISPLKDSLYFTLMVYGTLSMGLILLYLLVGSFLIFKIKSIPIIEGVSLLASLIIFTFFCSNWGMVYFDI